MFLQLGVIRPEPHSYLDIVDPARMQGNYTLATYLTLPP